MRPPKSTSIDHKSSHRSKVILHDETELKPTQAPVSKSGWPSELGTPSTSGSSPEMRDAYFPQKRRLAVDRLGVLTI